MRSYDKYRDVRFIQKTDIGNGILLTIKEVKEEDVSAEGPEKIKYVIYFMENFRPWVPNIGSLEEIKSINGTGDVDRWPGTVIVLYINPDVEHQGKKVGGIRCRAPKAGYSQQTQISGSQTEETEQTTNEDDIPF